MTQKPTIFLCVGATKAGTSWLFEQLAMHPECHLRAIKELHYFNTVSQKSWNARLRFLGEQAARMKPGGRMANDMAAWMDVMRLRRLSLNGYLSYLCEGRGTKRVVADITPAYSLLSARLLSRMAKIGDVRVLYLMRDPVERLWSQIRMDAKRQSFVNHEIPAFSRRLLTEALEKKGPAWPRGDYAEIIPKLEAAIPAGQLKFAFYETLTSPGGMNAISDFLGIARRPAAFDKHVHKGVDLPMEAEDRARAMTVLRPQYEYVARRMGTLPDAWQANLAGV